MAVLSGGNVDPGLLASVARRHETQVGRRLVLITRVPDRPGNLAGLLVQVAETGANIVDVSHVREGLELHVRETAIELVLETRGQDHAENVVAALREAGLRDARPELVAPCGATSLAGCSDASTIPSDRHQRNVWSRVAPLAGAPKDDWPKNTGEMRSIRKHKPGTSGQTTKPPVVPGTRGAPQEKLFHLTAEGTYEFTRERQGQSVYFGATTKLRWTATGSVTVTRTGVGDLRARAGASAGRLVGLQEDTVTRAETPRPNGTWLTSRWPAQATRRPVPLAGTLVGARSDAFGPSFLDADVPVERQASGTADPICLPPFGGGPDTRHVYPMDLVWLPPVESDWDFMRMREGSFAAGWRTACRQSANRAGREVWEFAVTLTPRAGDYGARPRAISH